MQIVILNFSFFLPTTYMIDEMLIVQLLAPMMTINHHHHHCHGNEHYQTDGCTDVDGRGGGVDDNGDIVDFDEEAGGTRETKC